MLIKHNTNILVELSQNDSKTCFVVFMCQGIDQSLESIISIFIYMNIRILIYHIKDIIYQNNPKPHNLDTVSTFQSAISLAIVQSQTVVQYKFCAIASAIYKIMSKFNF